jgi:hypothetical protein
MAAATTIPETVTVPGQLVYDAIVKITAAKHGMMALSDSAETPLGDEFGHARYRLYEAAFGEFMADDDVVAPLARAAEAEASELLRECVGLVVDV